jgi:hypothetical protein
VQAAAAASQRGPGAAARSAWLLRCYMYSILDPLLRVFDRATVSGPKKGEITTHSTDSATLFERKESD